MSTAELSAPVAAREPPPLRRRFIKGLLALCAFVSVATTVGIVVALLLPALDFFREVSVVDFLTGKDWSPLFEPAHFGVLPLVSAHVGRHDRGRPGRAPSWARLRDLPQRVRAPARRSIVKPALEVLAGIPTVVFGFFALTFVTPLLRDLGLEVEIFNALSAGLVMGVMLIPTVASLSEDAMVAVPRELRDGAYALGSSRLQVSTRIVVPAAIPASPPPSCLRSRAQSARR